MTRRPQWREFLYAGLASCLAEATTIPLDVIKVRMQLQGEQGAQRAYANSVDACIKIFRSEGIPAFWKGLAPALLRQGTYGTMRVGLYVPAKRALGVKDDCVAANPLRKMSAGVMSGAFSSAICNPTDLIKVRMQAAGERPDGPMYRGIGHAARTIIKKEGLRGLYMGVGPTIARASVVAAAELGSYDEIKTFFLRQGILDGFRLHLGTAALAGLCATAASSPFDVIKSRVMSQALDEHGRGIQYKGMVDCFGKSLRSEGMRFMWKGFAASYMVKGPSVVIFFTLYEALKSRMDAYFNDSCRPNSPIQSPDA